MRAQLSNPITLSDVIKYTGAKCFDYPDTLKIYGVSNDTRNLMRGDLYIAMSGDNFDGEDYCEDARRLGAIVMSKRELPFSLAVKDTGIALLNLAKGYKLALTSLKSTVAITGSNGKTTTKEMLSRLTKNSIKVHATEGNRNNLIGVPFTILSSPKDTELLIIEMGSNSKGEIKRLSDCAEPSLAIITNIGSAHIGNFGSRENIASEKSDIYSGGKIIYPYGEPLLSFKGGITVSTDCIDADYYLTGQGNELKLFHKGAYVGKATTSLQGKHILYCLAFATAVAIELGLEVKEVLNRIQGIGGECVRHTLIDLGNYKILDDSYNASFESVCASLSLHSQISKERSVVLGDMLELGKYTELLHKKAGEAVYLSGAYNLYAFGKYAEYVSEGAIASGMPKDRIFINCNLDKPEITVKQILDGYRQNELILFKGSNKVGLGRIIKLLKE